MEVSNNSNGVGDELALFLGSLSEVPRLDELEAAAIRDALQRYEGNRTRTARALGISLRTLQRKLKCDHDGLNVVKQMTIRRVVISTPGDWVSAINRQASACDGK